MINTSDRGKVELMHRLALWNRLNLSDPVEITPTELRALKLYGGAQGIWVDKKRTKSLTTTGEGVAVSLLHTGRVYNDDLSDDGLIYHYPDSNRPTSRDAGEIAAVKAAAAIKIPVFAILPARSRSTHRMLRLGWVVDWDDDTQQFLILFSDDPPIYQRAVPPDAPFSLTDDKLPRYGKTKMRGGQQRFRFQVLEKYGCKCAVCEITHPQLIKAAHLVGKAVRGSDDWRNGIPLCSTHHDAFDAYLFGIDPSTHAIHFKPGIVANSIGVTTHSVTLIRNIPHIEALQRRHRDTMTAWTYS